MAKRVFFSFHYDDVSSFRANVVRKHHVVSPEDSEAVYFDASVWEEARKQGDVALKGLINGAIENTSVTCVLIGSETYDRDWVAYEIFKSIEKGNHLLGVHINGIKDKYQQTKANGSNPFEELGLYFSEDGCWATPCRGENGKWVGFALADKFRLSTPIEASRRGRIAALSTWYRVHDWARDDGYNFFKNWIKQTVR